MVTDVERTRDLKAAWGQKYQGTALESFLQAMRWYEASYDKSIYDGRTIAILQSSGCGKSRLVDELALKHPVFDVCVRKTKDLTSGWPPGDTPALKVFEDHAPVSIDIADTTTIRGEEMAAVFLGALIGAIADDFDISRLKGKRSESSYGLPGSPQTTGREQFLQAVSDRGK